MKLIFAIIASSLSFAVAAQGFVVDSQGKAVRDSQGECVRTDLWTSADKLAECDKTKPAAVVLVPKTRAPVVTQPVAPVAPIVSKVTVQADVLFEFDKYELTTQGKVALDKVADDVKPGTKIVVVGHTDVIGNPNYNIVLSQQRAKVVGNYLNTKVKNATLEVSGVGSKDPTKDTEKCKAIKNWKQKVACYAPDRRVDVEYIAK